MSPDVLVLDEPTSNMDPGAKWSLIELIKSLEVTIVIVSHDLELIEETCNRVIVFNSGRVVSEGSTQEVLSDRVLLSKHNLSR
jgi:cobalt/nickel transport system ATP-binding protein